MSQHYYMVSTSNVYPCFNIHNAIIVLNPGNTIVMSGTFRNMRTCILTAPIKLYQYYCSLVKVVYSCGLPVQGPWGWPATRPQNSCGDLALKWCLRSFVPFFWLRACICESLFLLLVKEMLHYRLYLNVSLC